MYITRRERFSSAHKLVNKNISDINNDKLFGKCYQLHGHNYELFVTVTGDVNPKTGMIIDLKDLKKIINDRITSKIDHNIINNVSFMENKIATTENLCVAIWDELEAPIKKMGAQLYKIKIFETENNFVEYFG
tara:strand:+ start:432 stop:830 length:399 start_codon:yes stop_codon:yes gene_type:complete